MSYKETIFVKIKITINVKINVGLTRRKEEEKKRKKREVYRERWETREDNGEKYHFHYFNNLASLPTYRLRNENPSLR